MSRRLPVLVVLAVLLLAVACDGEDGADRGDVTDSIAPEDGAAAEDGAGPVDAASDRDTVPPTDATAPDAADDDAGGSDTAPDALSPAPDPAEPGPWLAGVRTLTLVDETRGRTLPVDVWYPVDPAADDGGDNVYEMTTSLGVLGRLPTPARRDATPAAGGAWPLVVFSHGFGGIRFQSYFLTEHLATHGYVVAAPDHVGNTLADFALLNDDEAVAQSSVDRPLDVLFVRDTLVADPAWDVDAARTAVSGHSFGGWTCIETAARDAGFRAVVALAPGFLHDSSPTRAADVVRPLAIFAGSADRTTPFEEHQEPAYDAAAPPRLLVTFRDAGHFDFTALCELPAARPVYDGDGCDAEKADWHALQADVATVAAAFLGVHVLGDERYRPFLANGAIEALGDAAGDVTVRSEP